MIRIFLATPLPPAWSESFLEISKKNSILEKIRWTPPDNLHITLFFIGEVEESNLENILSELEKLFEAQKSFILEFENVELRGKKSHPSMLWGKFRKSEMFSQLSEKIFHSVKEFMTIDVVHNDPIPHCTLARIKPGANTDLINLKIGVPEKFISIHAAELWKTVQSKEGVRYERLQHWNLIA
jgi:RNA 2',3'-cyclic 3'-phosphodiesterase